MILREFQRIKVVVLDVDGVLTDGRVLVTESGEQLRMFHVRDGYAMQEAIKARIQIWVISGGQSIGVEKRLRGLGIEHIFLGVADKKNLLQELMRNFDVDADVVMYVGDDMPDLDAMQLVGLPACPSDAAEEIKAISRYMSPGKGGAGAVRDILEKVLKIQGKWPSTINSKSI